MELNIKQINQANKLLTVLCKRGRTGRDNPLISEIFSSDDDLFNVCEILKSKELIGFTELINRKICSLIDTNSTCNAVKNDILMKEYKKTEQLNHKESLEVRNLKLQIKTNKFSIIKSYWWLLGIFLGMCIYGKTILDIILQRLQG